MPSTHKHHTTAQPRMAAQSIPCTIAISTDADRDVRRQRVANPHQRLICEATFLAIGLVAGGCSTTDRLREDVLKLRQQTGSEESPRGSLIVFVPDKPPCRALEAIEQPEVAYAASQWLITIIVSKDRVKVRYRGAERSRHLNCISVLKVYVDAPPESVLVCIGRNELYRRLVGKTWSDLLSDEIVLADADLNPIRSENPLFRTWEDYPRLIKEHARFDRGEYDEWIRSRKDSSASVPDKWDVDQPSHRGFVHSESATQPRDLLRGAYTAVHFAAVGINQYEHADPQMPHLRCAENDAKAVAQAFEHLNWRRTCVVLGKAASDKSIRDALRQLAGKADSDDAIVIFFAGHGRSFETADGMQGAILP